MELANVPEMSYAAGSVRTAVRADAGSITRLLRTSRYGHIHADWRLPGDWLGAPGFVVAPEPQPSGLWGNLFNARPRLRACLVAAADPPPVAWVRVAAIADVARPETALAAMLARVKENLRETAVTQLAWLATQTWPNAWLPDLGFVCVNQVETYVKDDMDLPPIASVSGLEIRPVRPDDMEMLARLEAAAFDPLWRYSADALALARGQSLSFDVALLPGQVVGFQLSMHSESGAHLVRLTVAPELHQQGVGTVLLAHAIKGYRRRQLQRVSLNTQVDNVASQCLYRKFGFYASGQRLPVWVMAF